MTTKWRIISGFVVMVVIVGVVVFLGYTGIQRSSEGFMEYRRLARLNVSTSELEVCLDAASSSMYAYIGDRNEKRIMEAKSSITKFRQVIDEAEAFAKNAATVELIASLKREIGTLDSNVDQVHQTTMGNDKQYNDSVLVAARAIIAQLIFMTNVAEKTGNSAALSDISRVWSDLTSFMSGISRYANSHTSEDADIVRGYIRQLDVSLKDLGEALPSEAGRKDFAALWQQYEALTTAFGIMTGLSAELTKNLTAMESFIENTLVQTQKLSSDINNQMVSYGTSTLQSNDNAQKYMMITGLSGLFVGIIIAMVIVFGIIRVLRDLSAFAGAVARGDFDYRIRIREKGEIGSMVEAMKEIPGVLGRIIATTNDLANDIRKGRLRDRIDTGTLAGSFSGLGVAVNTVSDAFSELMDMMPVAVMACNRDLTVVYTNKSGQDVLGGEAVTKQCNEQLSAPECNTANCLGKQAMNSKAPVTGETVVHPQGKRLDVFVTAIPLFDMNGEPAGFVEIITDLTEIKAKQAIMLKVAQDASAISDRVAAASEQLAAQVEQISRGAEMQRERVESTASAMNEMNSTVLEVARNASQASEQSEGTRSKAEEGAHLVGQVVDAIDKVNTIGGKLHENMQELGQQAQSIGGVMNVISDIADQTNLLALNAAIEAARAGEAGRGFAVVADEVRKLAEKTMEATQEVGSNINAIQQSARVNIEEVDNAVKSVSEATLLAGSSGEALKEIVSLAAANSTVVASIATAAEQQSATSEEINSAVEEINRITGETTDGMVQSSGAVQELSRMAQELRRVMEGLR